MSDHSPFYAPSHPATARQPRPGAVLWSLEEGHHTYRCELRDHGELAGVEIQIYRDGEFLFGQRWPSGELALKQAEEIKLRYVRAGGAVVG